MAPMAAREGRAHPKTSDKKRKSKGSSVGGYFLTSFVIKDDSKVSGFVIIVCLQGHWLWIDSECLPSKYKT